MPRKPATADRTKGTKAIRLGVYLGPATLCELDRIASALEAESRADAFRAALHITGRLVREYAAGARVTIRRDGVERELILAVPFAEGR